MTKKYLYGLWIILTILSTIFILIKRYRSSLKWGLQLKEVFDLALAILGGVSGGYLIFQSVSLHEQLQKLVENEGIAAMALGGLAPIWFGINKINELASKKSR